VGRKKKIADRKIVATPTIDPYVPGAGRKYPTPSTVATAYASRGFRVLSDEFAAALVFSSVRLFGPVRLFGSVSLIAAFATLVSFAEHRFRHNVLFRRPIPQIALPAAFAAKGKFLVQRGIRWRFANWALVLHGLNSSAFLSSSLALAA
jgi:hypothetical protein